MSNNDLNVSVTHAWGISWFGGFATHCASPGNGLKVEIISILNESLEAKMKDHVEDLDSGYLSLERMGCVSVPLILCRVAPGSKRGFSWILKLEISSLIGGFLWTLEAENIKAEMLTQPSTLLITVESKGLVTSDKTIA
ncbi:hypothetical protein MaudCBS49596_006879 [Microsporum audouinii]